VRGLEAAVREALDRRLLPASPHPVAVALSGGGDSLALTLLADAWARDHGRGLVILTVDHGLRAESAAWTARCGEIAARLGRPFRALSWEGGKPITGLPAAARGARHRLLADAAREGGARVILMGHTADDIAEARAMRAEGSTTPDPREWAPSPVWPEGRGVFLLRPMLGQRRASLRAWLDTRGATWIDDPGNEDPRFARSRARAAGPTPAIEAAQETPVSELCRVADHAGGAITIPRRTLRAAAADEVQRFVSLACVCAGGGERRPATDRLRRLADAVRSSDGAFVATLAGARVEAGEQGVEIFREAGEFHRRGSPPLPLPLGQEVVWDGRYALTAHTRNLLVRPAVDVADALSDDDRGARPVSARRRGGSPAIIYPDGDTRLALCDRPDADVTVRSLVRARLEAAAGLVQREPA
jgi:tRNA(Ile)-lysidine synthase